MTRTALNPIRLVKAAALVLACSLLLLAFGQAARAHAGVRRAPTIASPDVIPYSVTLEQCTTSTVQAERSATFTAQMTATGATQRMGMRIELQQRMRGEPDFHTVMAPGFGVWRPSEPGVKIYKYVKQVTNLAAPAAYRAVVRFRWLGGRGRVLKRAELRTPRCLEPTLSRQVTQTSPTGPAPAA
jgi:hypothetical protein